MIYRDLPLIGTVFLLAIVFVWRPWLQYQRQGHWGILLFRSNSIGQIARDCLAIAVFILLLAQAIVETWWPERLASLAVNDGIATEKAAPIGMVLFFGGLLLLVIAQLDLGASWRIGIDKAAKPGLVTHGLYRFCRNPIYLALLIIVAGYALVVPTVLSIALVIGAYTGIRTQTYAEEHYLLGAYGEAYRSYASRVGRFLPWFGKL